MTPFTQPHPLSSLPTLYVYQDEGAETLATGMCVAAGAVVQFGSRSQGQTGSRLCQTQ